MKKILVLITILVFSIISKAQPTKSFCNVHCDPNEAYNFPNLEILVDSANRYNIKLTIEFTVFLGGQHTSLSFENE